MPPTSRSARPRSTAPARNSSVVEALDERRRGTYDARELQVIFDNAIVGIALVYNRIHLKCNRTLEEMFGYGPGELDGQSVRILYSSEEAYRRVGRELVKYLQEDRYVHEAQMVRKDGQLRWCQMSGRALDPRRPLGESIWVVQDVTERRLAEESLREMNRTLEGLVEERTRNLRRANLDLKREIERRQRVQEKLTESREKYRVLFRTFPIGIAITDEDGDIVEVNRALYRMTGRRSIDEIQAIGRRPNDLIRPDSRTAQRETLARVVALREHRRIEDDALGVLRPDGTRVWLATTAAPIPVRGYGVVAAYTDVTEKRVAAEKEKQRQSELARAARLSVLGEMASALAHELGQPLSAALGYLDGVLLRLKAVGGHGSSTLGPYKPALALAKRHVEQAGEIVTRVRHYARRHSPRRGPVDLNRLCRDVASFLRADFQAQGVQVRFTLTPHLPHVSADRVEMEQVVLNLLKNSIEASSGAPPKRLVVEVATRKRSRSGLELSVSDHGGGVPPRDLKRIFEPYFTTKKEGLGLGLSICRTIVESHGGHLTARRRKPHGMTFSLVLPID